jgi:hypothetical protein
MLTSTVLIMLVLPAMYAIMDDIGFVKLTAAQAGIKHCCFASKILGYLRS